MDFNSFHSIYKSLKKLKQIIVSKSIFGNAEMVEDTYDVYSARLQELLSDIEQKSSNEKLSSRYKARLAAMALCLKHDYLKISINRPSEELTAVNELEQQLLDNDHNRFDEFIALIYLKSLLLLTKSRVFDSMEHKNQEYWLNTASEMYLELSSKFKNMPIYDCNGIFADSKEPIPLTEDQKLITTNAIMKELASKLHLVENPPCFDHFIDISGLQRSEQLCKQSPLVWVRKLLSLVPHSLQQKNFKCASYYLLTAAKALDLYASDTNTDLVTNVRSSIITLWVHYTFAILNASKSAWVKGLINPSIAKSFQNDSTFKCFSKIVPLKPEHLQLCIDPPMDVGNAGCLVSFSVGLIKQLIKLGDFTARPLNYIKHVYQIMDLFNVLTYLLNDPERGYLNRLQQFQHFDRLIQWLLNHHSNLFDVLSSDLLNELDEIITQLYEANQNRKRSKNPQASKQ